MLISCVRAANFPVHVVIINTNLYTHAMHVLKNNFLKQQPSAHK